MKAKELIDILSKNPEAIVVHTIRSITHGDIQIPVRGTIDYKGELKGAFFKDAFTGDDIAGDIIERVTQVDSEDGKDVTLKQGTINFIEIK